MANRTPGIYNELFGQLPIPERLEPENIAAMLSEYAASSENASKRADKATAKRAAPIDISAGSRKTGNSADIGAGRRTSPVYRSVASIAACAALALGVVGYLNSGRAPLPEENPNPGGAYASDYNDVHKTFAKYYVDDEDKRTLDSAIEDIEHSYNGNEMDPSQVNEPSQDTPAETEAVSPAETTAPDTSSTDVQTQTPPPEETEPADTPATPPAQEDDGPVTVEDGLPIPPNDAVVDTSDTAFGNGFMLRQDGNILRIITTVNGITAYTDNIFPSYEGFSSKTLAGFYADGSKAIAVYSVVTGETPAVESQPRDGVVGGLLDSLYGPEEAPVEKPRSAVEVCIYDIADGLAYLGSDTVQGGSLINMNYVNGALYLVTAYDDYRTEPIAGVDDLENYVPTYTVNGNKFYVSASDIMIPDYISNTDYTVISGITADGAVSVKAVLGYEGRVVMKNGAVYLFSYDNSAGTDLTSVRVFSLAGGNVIYAGYTDIEGVALGGDGIASFGDAVVVTAIRKSEGAYITSLGVYDGTMNFISGFDYPAALTSAKRVGSKIILSGIGGKCVADLSNLSVPSVTEGEPAKNPAEGLLSFNGGYVTLTKNASGQIELSKLADDGSGGLVLISKTLVCAENGADSKALENNGILFVSGDTVGVPYGFFDGLDYCYRYAIYRETPEGFALIGETEVHETDKTFEYGEAILNGGVLYIMSDGRVSAAVVGNSLAVISSADIVEGSHSAHR